MTEKKLAAKLAEVMAECAHIQKNGFNSAQNYKFVKADDVASAVNAALSSRGIAIKHAFRIESRSQIPTKSGGFLREVTVGNTVTFIDGVTGERETTGEAFGSGSDNSDKDLSKAQTAAIKQQWRATFSISDGEDTEADESVDRATSGGYSAPAQQYAPRPQAAPQHPTSYTGEIVHNRSLSFGFGNNKGRPISDLTVKDIEWYIAASERDLGNPEKARFHEKSRQAIASMRAEIAMRNGGSSAPAGGDLFQDEIPF